MVSCWPKMGPMNVAVGVVPLTDLYKEGQQTKYTAVEVPHGRVFAAGNQMLILS